MRAKTGTEPTVAPARPEGGYRPISIARAARAWWAFREGRIGLRDLRTFFACHEIRARRCGAPSGVPHRYDLDELRGLVGGTTKRLRASLRKLEDEGLLAWGEAGIDFDLPGGDPGAPELAGFRAFLGQIPNNKRLLPVPRRVLREIVKGARPALIATILGHLIRGLYARREDGPGVLRSWGRCKASWIARTFGVDLRRVKEARRELVRRNWLLPEPSFQWERNRWGATFRINLAWAPGGDPVPAGGQGLPPPPAVSGQELPPPDSDKEPLKGLEDQEPADRGPSGFRIPERVGGNPPSATAPGPAKPEMSPPAPSATKSPATPPAPSTDPRPVAKPPAPSASPRLRDVVPDDLRDTGRTLELFRQAAREGLVGDSEADRLRFVAAAEHARALGDRNPCGLFVRLVRGKLWHFLTQADEGLANARIKRHCFGAPGPGPIPIPIPLPIALAAVPPPRAPAPAPALSDDARIARAVRDAAARAGHRGDPFYLLKREKPEWTRDRWDRALREGGPPGRPGAPPPRGLADALDRRAGAFG